MGHYAAWKNSEKTIIHCQLVPEWDWNDFFDSVSDSYMMIRTVRHEVDVIITGINGRHPPENTLRYLNNIIAQKPDHMGYLVLVDSGKVMQVIHRYFLEIHNGTSPILFADTLDDARAQLAALDVANLP